jgi:outer membrane protein
MESDIYVKTNMHNILMHKLDKYKRSKIMYKILSIVILLVSIVFSQSEPLSLDDCINIALKMNPNIIINQNMNKSAGENVIASYSGILPKIDLNATTGRYEAGNATDLRDFPVGYDSTGDQAIIERRLITQPGFIVNYNNFGLQVNQNIFDGGEWWNAIRYAKSTKRASDQGFQSAINFTILDVQNKFFDLLKQQNLLGVYELAVKRSEDQLAKSEKMFELGAIAKVDVYRNKVNLGNDKIQYLQQKNAFILAKNNLNIAMGRDPNDSLAIKPELNLIPAYQKADTLIKTAIDNNPNIKKYKEDFYSSELMVARSKSAFFPQLGAYFNYSRSNEELQRVYSNYDQNWNISYGLSLSLNLFNGFRDKVNIQKNKLAAKNNLVTYEEAKRTLKADIIQLIDNYNSYLKIIEINQENLEAAKEEYRLAEERYRVGSGTALELREAQVNLTRAEQILVAAQYNARITQAQMENSLGTISSKYSLKNDR